MESWLNTEAPKKAVALKMFGQDILFVNGMVCLNDIYRAYCEVSGKEWHRDTVRDWKRRNGVSELIEFLSEPGNGFYSGGSARMESYGVGSDTLESQSGKSDRINPKVLGYPRGRNGGLYACRELAHHFASWLDVKYAAYVLRVFDDVIKGDTVSAHLNSHKVCEEITDIAYSAGKDRLDTSAAGYTKYLKITIGDGLGLVSKEEVPQFLMLILREDPESALFLREILTAAEGVSSVIDADHMSALRGIKEFYAEDPRLENLLNFTEKYNEGEYHGD